MEKGSDRELKRGTLELMLLKLLSERPMYGYEIVATLGQRGGVHFSIKEGTLYPILYRLEKAGWVEPYWQTLERGVPRKYYRLTEAGDKQLHLLIREWQTFVMTVNNLLGLEDDSK